MAGILMHWLKVFSRCVVLAHREAPPVFLKTMKSLPTDVVSVNSFFAKPFKDAGYKVSDVYYGVTNGDKYFPSPDKTENGVIEFAVLGNINNAWKGADTAIEAVKALPKEIQSRIKLHLASYIEEPPIFEEECIVPYRWMSSEQIPEFLRSIDVLIVPSRDLKIMKETVSQAMVQGMLSGLAILANDLPILTEKLDQGGGLVFKNSSELAKQIIELVENNDLRARLGEEARETAQKRYVWNSQHFINTYLFPNDS